MKYRVNIKYTREYEFTVDAPNEEDALNTGYDYYEAHSEEDEFNEECFVDDIVLVGVEEVSDDDTI